VGKLFIWQRIGKENAHVARVGESQLDDWGGHGPISSSTSVNRELRQLVGFFSLFFSYLVLQMTTFGVGKTTFVDLIKGLQWTITMKAIFSCIFFILINSQKNLEKYVKSLYYDLQNWKKKTQLQFWVFFFLFFKGRKIFCFISTNKIVNDLQS
jgi:hypothetical protein